MYRWNCCTCKWVHYRFIILPDLDHNFILTHKEKSAFELLLTVMIPEKTAQRN
jgi:hypothetical protein